jgi:uncharacterized protein (DUF2147 family)
LVSRKISITLSILLWLSAGAGAALAQANTDSVYGYWINRNGWVIEAAPCGDEICGHIVAVGGRSENPQRFDEFNPDPALRDRPLCGVAIFGSFVLNGEPNEWEDGWIYNPQDGKTYSSNMELADNGDLEVRGYVLSPMFGRTIVLTRGEEPTEPCDTDEIASAESPEVE